MSNERFESPYMTTAEAAVYLLYSGARAREQALLAIRRNGVPTYRRGGRTVLVRRDDLAEMLATGRCDAGVERKHRVRTRRR